MILRTKISIAFVISVSVAGGVYFGTNEADTKVLKASADELVLPATIDPRHPIETYTAPLFIDSQTTILHALKIQATPEDHVTLTPGIQFGVGGQVVIERALPIQITDANQTTTYRTWANTVHDLLVEQHIDLGDNDKIDPSQESELKLDETVVITRVAITELTETQSVSFKTKTQDDPARPKGEKKTLQKGVAGSKKLTYSVRRENGKEVSRKLIKTEQTKDPVDELISIGTKPVITVKCKWDDYVLDAAAKNGVDANALCYRMIRESNGNPGSDGGQYKGLFQYDPGFWADASAKAGYSGADIWDAKSQVYVTAWAWAHGYRGRWPQP